MKKSKILKFCLSFAGILAITSCNQTIEEIISPSYEGGKEGNEDNDQVVYEDDTTITDLFTSISTISKFSYKVDFNISGTYPSFTGYYTPNAYYIDYGKASDSLGFAQTKDDNYLFRYYINDEANEVYPSVYEYVYYEGYQYISGLYSALAISHPSLLSETLDTLTYTRIDMNTYLITDDESLSVFQYMTNVGSSIASYITALYIDIVSLDDLIFDARLDLGSYGEIVGRYTPLETTKIDFVNEAIINGNLTGVNEFSEVREAANLMALNNFTLSGIRVENSTSVANSNYKITCTPSYFYFDYQNEAFSNFGYAFIKAHTAVPVHLRNQETGEIAPVTTTYNLNYDACFEYEINSDGEIYFTLFVGPVESDMSYLVVDALPEIGDSNTLYIYDGSVYEWVLDGTTGEYRYSRYSSWYENVGAFYIENYGTFYPDASGLTEVAPLYFEKLVPGDNNNHSFYTDNLSVTSLLSSGLFGWGFQPTTTWMDYVTNAYLDINYSDNNEISSFDLGLGINASVDGGTYEEQKITYNFSNFGTSKIDLVEEFMKDMLVEVNE